MGEKVLASLNDDRIVAKNEIDEILKFYHVKSREVPDSIEDMNEQLEYLMRPLWNHAPHGLSGKRLV